MELPESFKRESNTKESQQRVYKRWFDIKSTLLRKILYWENNEGGRGGRLRDSQKRVLLIGALKKNRVLQRINKDFQYTEFKDNFYYKSNETVLEKKSRNGVSKASF